MKTKSVLFVLIIVFFCSAYAYAGGLDGVWVSEDNVNTYEINVNGDNICTIKQYSTNYVDAMRFTELHDCVADMSASVLSYTVYRAELRSLQGRKSYEYDKLTGDSTVYSAPFKLGGNQLFIGNVTLYKK